MSKLDTTITVKQELRPCTINGRKGLFHTWEQFHRIVPPSPMVGGHLGGQICEMFALVEFETGGIERISPDEVVFVDNKVAEYIYFKPEEGEKNG